MSDGPEWFAPKRYGLGAALPCSWQGWLVLTLYMVVVVGCTIVFEDRPIVIVAIILPLTIALLLITARTTKGGWRWRWGGDD